MAADSPRRQARLVPTTVPPQAVNDRSVLDSVAGFINDVTLTSVQPQTDPKSQIQWAHFENMADISDPMYGDDWDIEGGVAPPLLLILGYGNGVQVWAIPANGEAIEVLGWRHGAVRALRILPTPTIERTDHVETTLDQYADQRPLMAICDSNCSGSSGVPATMQFCSVNFVSLKDGDQVKSIKFKNPILDILANRSSIVLTFAERIAVFDARNFEDRLTVTTCHPSPGINLNPVALGSRWMAYAERKLLPSKRSSGGCDCDGVQSYTATVLNAAKSLGKGLRELGEQMAAGLTGSVSSSTSSSSGFGMGNGMAGHSFDSEGKQPGIITVLDIKYPVKDLSPTTGTPISTTGSDPIVAHFIAHTDAIVSIAFDCSGMLLFTADKRGHDFHIFRIQSHPSGPSLAAVHHLYVLHRGDTTAKVQNVTFSLDSRWVAVSTLRGTTHVFPITPYGGSAGVRTHGSPHVVNRLSRFHRSAGLSVDGRSSSPILGNDQSSNLSNNAYTNPRIPPFPHPTVVLPLSQLRQPYSLGTANGSGGSGGASSLTSTQSGGSRQRISSLSDDNPLRIAATFARARAWLLDLPGAQRDLPAMRMQRKAVDSLFVMGSHGALIQYDLEPKHVTNVPKDKVCDETSIELEVEARAQWNLMRKETSIEIQSPLPPENWLLRDRRHQNGYSDMDDMLTDKCDDRWLSQVEILTHAGPHRRLWMGPQFTFKTYNTPSGASLSHIDLEAIEVGLGSSGNRPVRSNPMNMPTSSATTAGRSIVPILIESGSCSSYEQSPRLLNQFRGQESGDANYSLSGNTLSGSTGGADIQLREDLADAMKESPGGVYHTRDTSGHSNTSTLSSGTDGSGHMGKKPIPSPTSLSKMVNPLGTVTTMSDTIDDTAETSDEFILENCDESLFRPVVAVFEKSTDTTVESPLQQRPEPIGKELIVPVIEECLTNRLIGTDDKPPVSVLSDPISTDKIVTEETQPIEKLKTKRKSKRNGGGTQKLVTDVVDAALPPIDIVEKCIEVEIEKPTVETVIDVKIEDFEKVSKPSNDDDDNKKLQKKKDKKKTGWAAIISPQTDILDKQDVHWPAINDKGKKSKEPSPVPEPLILNSVQNQTDPSEHFVDTEFELLCNNFDQQPTEKTTKKSATTKKCSRKKQSPPKESVTPPDIPLEQIIHTNLTEQFLDADVDLLDTNVSVTDITPASKSKNRSHKKQQKQQSPPKETETDLEIAPFDNIADMAYYNAPPYPIVTYNQDDQCQYHQSEKIESPIDLDFSAIPYDPINGFQYPPENQIYYTYDIQDSLVNGQIATQSTTKKSNKKKQFTTVHHGDDQSDSSICNLADDQPSTGKLSQSILDGLEDLDYENEMCKPLSTVNWQYLEMDEEYLSFKSTEPDLSPTIGLPIDEQKDIWTSGSSDDNRESDTKTGTLNDEELQPLILNSIDMDKSFEPISSVPITKSKRNKNRRRANN